MSSIAAELNSLSTATVIDFYRRLMPAGRRRTRHYLHRVEGRHRLLGRCSRAWSPCYAVNLGSLIEVVNRFGSFFYGSLLGVFILAIGFKRANGIGAFVGLIAGMTAVGFVALNPATSSFPSSGTTSSAPSSSRWWAWS